MKIHRNRRFYDLWSNKQDAALTRRIAWYCAQRSGRFSEDLMKMVHENDLRALCAYSITYSTSDSVLDLRYARQCLSLYNKDASLVLTDTKRAMWLGFVESEIKNRATNIRWSSLFESGKLLTCEDGFVVSVSRKITQILGDCPALSELEIGFGPGASATVKRTTTPRHKLDATPTCSKEMATIIESLVATDMPSYWAVHQSKYKVIPGTLSSVHKNAFTERTILIEPTLCTLYQKGVGRKMKDRLFQFGCNLYEQRRNQQLALQGSLDGLTATVDVRNASNTQALLMVYHSCPETWFDLLWSLRTGTVNYQGREHELEMFSSMGNGFTFELESLIFYAIALTVCERKNADPTLVSVYGDDIIIPVECYEDLNVALAFYGFEINKSKSYAEGPFRESCGADYFLGTNIRPFYKKDRWTDARLVGFLNKDARSETRLFDPHFVSGLKACLSPGSKNYGPDGYGDGHLIDGFSRTDLSPCIQTPKQVWKHGQKDGCTFDTIIKSPLKDDSRCRKGDRLLPLYLIYQAPQLKSRMYDRQCRFIGPRRPRDIILDTVELLDSIPTDTESLSNISARESDPFVVRGGWRSRRIKVYTFAGQFSEENLL